MNHGLDMQTLILLELVVLLAATAQGMLGFAFGMIAMGFSTFLLDVRAASILMSPLAGANAAIGLWSVRRELDFRIVAPMALGLLLGLPFGLAILLGGSTTFLRIFLGLLLIYVGVSRFVPVKIARSQLSTWWGWLAGIVAGVVGGATNMGGPPLIAYGVRQSWSPGVFKASLLATFVVSTSAKTVILVGRGAFDGPLVVMAFALLPAVCVGTVIGVMLFNRIDGQRFGYLVAALVALLGLCLIFR